MGEEFRAGCGSGVPIAVQGTRPGIRIPGPSKGSEDPVPRTDPPSVGNALSKRCQFSTCVWQNW